VTPTTSALQPLPPLSVELFNPSYDKDKFENTALTVNGTVGDLKLVYSGGYLVRHINEIQDYTNYSRGVFAAYYQCTGGGLLTVTATPQCFSPSSTWHESERSTHQSHEIRLSTPDDWRVRGIGGLYWERYSVVDDTEWDYTQAGAGFYPIGPPTGADVSNGSIRGVNTSFFDDFERGYTQKAAFGSFDVEAIPKTLILTLGTRYYRFDNSEVGATVGGLGCRPNGIYDSGPTVPNPCVNASTDEVALNASSKDAGFKSRANLSWHVTPDALVYYTWSQGYRPGGFNRPGAVIPPTSPLYGIFTQPLTYKPDTLINNEVGWKTEWFDRRLEFNGAYYIEDWKNAQISVFDPEVTGNLTFTTNGPNYRVHGLETSVIGRVTHELTVTGSAAWNTSRLVSEPTLIGTNGQPVPQNPYGPISSPLAQSPPFQGNVRVRYDFNVGDYKAFWQVGGTHQAHSYSTTDHLTLDLQGNSIVYNQAGFSTYDASFGVAKDAWLVTFYGQNLTNTVADLFTNYSQWIKAETVNRPRTLGLKFSYKF
jgi:outer membrane receptor protein involved in Fe transport